MHLFRSLFRPSTYYALRSRAGFFLYYARGRGAKMILGLLLSSRCAKQKNRDAGLPPPKKISSFEQNVGRFVECRRRCGCDRSRERPCRDGAYAWVDRRGTTCWGPKRSYPRPAVPETPTERRYGRPGRPGRGRGAGTRARRAAKPGRRRRPLAPRVRPAAAHPPAE